MITSKIFLIFMVVLPVTACMISAPASGQDDGDEFNIVWSYNPIAPGLQGATIYDGTTKVGDVSEGSLSWKKDGYTPLRFQTSLAFFCDDDGNKITLEKANELAELVKNVKIGNTTITYYRYKYAFDFLVYTVTPLPSFTNDKTYIKTYTLPGWDDSILKQKTLHGNSLGAGTNYLLVAEQIAPENLYLTNDDYPDQAGPGTIWNQEKWYYPAAATLGRACATPSSISGYDFRYGSTYNFWDNIHVEHMILDKTLQYTTEGLDLNKIFDTTGMDDALTIIPSLSFTISPLAVDKIDIDGISVGAYAAVEDCTVMKSKKGEVKNLATATVDYDNAIRNVQPINPYTDQDSETPQSVNDQIQTPGATTTLTTTVLVQAQAGTLEQGGQLVGSVPGGALPLYVPNTDTLTLTYDERLSLRLNETQTVVLKPEMTIEPLYFVDNHKVSAWKKHVTYYNPWQFDVGVKYNVYPDGADVKSADVQTSMLVPTGMRLSNQFIAERYMMNVIISSVVDDERVFVPVPTGGELDDPEVKLPGGSYILPPGGATGTLTTPEEVVSTWDAILRWFQNPINSIITVIIIVVVVIGVVLVISSFLKRGSGGKEKIEVVVKMQYPEGTKPDERKQDGNRTARCSREPSRTLL